MKIPAGHCDGRFNVRARTPSPAAPGWRPDVTSRPARLSSVPLILVALVIVGLESRTPSDPLAQSVPVGPEFLVNTYLPTGGYARAASDAAGNFVVVWNGPAAPYGPRQGNGRLFDSAGIPRTAEFQINTYPGAPNSVPAVAMNDAGSFVVVWHSYNGTIPLKVFGRLFDSSGTPVTGELVVAAHTAYGRSFPDVAMD